MAFTDAQIEHYRTRGYVSGPRVLSDAQIEELKERIEDILHGRVAFPKHLMGETVEQSRAKGQLPSVKVVNIFRRDPLFASLVGNATISTLAHQLMAGPVRMWEDQMIYKPPHDEETALAWHQDYTFWDHVGPADLGTCWIALDDATVDNGCMHVIPGSHLWPMRYDREDAVVDDPHWLLSQKGIPAGADLTPRAPARSRPGTATSTTARPSTAPTETAPATPAAATSCTSCPATPGAWGTTGTSGWGTWRRWAWGRCCGGRSTRSWWGCELLLELGLPTLYLPHEHTDPSRL